MIEKLDAIGSQALKDLETAASLDRLEQVRISVLGKKGALSEVLKSLGAVSAEERPKIGAVANEWKRKIDAALELRKAQLDKAALDVQLAQERVDISLPARTPHRGALHPITQTTQRIIQVFSRIGFDVVTGPEVETDYLNFEAANIPADHPARDMQDTFFMGPGVVLRTHTTSVQMRMMRAQSWPVRILCPGAVYRSDSDATHSPMFHQIEGLWVDQNVKMSDLKGTLLFFAQELFGADAKIRLRPSYFPFVEPGAEVDVSCFQCRTKISPTCRVCKGSGWLEILGAGMVHPRLFDVAGYGEDYRSKNLTGFAFGLGIERIAMLLYGIPDLRLMFQGDVRFLNQF
ncbi:MAG: phenylalanine--tRNA ligase subunit alpha [Bdellovibrionales bacterium GWC1_52_8]|nr:MAG: phenylalanine--tRNA ligase subunit alpha [Bdellovibrionales bacterium GWB1_52_6]OFZ06091.1 MAG: phenylalanine--tRNA ligase subunit alpha [Bdellovibrionales bacterium GWA1_52_35]OFZ38679.1 MAG: phenylalanine--tRNA ligase subunit alpha [Bdellovibrionales bacterium GWC1_52_8]HCM39282.1 phenylalanine--tRNA ligase subunit alpha [Bdellovibrionales bacterium]